MNKVSTKFMMDRVYDVEFYCDCTSKGHWINDKLIPNSCVRFSYKKALKLIKEYLPDVYDSMGLKYHNPWNNKTYRSRNGRYIVITHSMIEYVFQTNLGQ